MDEVIPRRGNGEGIRPDKINAYSHVKIIESGPDKVVVHWRYLPEFSGLNPHVGVDATKFVDEYFTITPDGNVKRTIRQGTPKIDRWKDPRNRIQQSFTLTAKGITGLEAERTLAKAGMAMNKNIIPFDARGPQVTSGLRIGTPALTTRGMKEPEIRIIADLIRRVLENPDNEKVQRNTRTVVSELCRNFPIYEFLDGPEK